MNTGDELRHLAAELRCTVESNYNIEEGYRLQLTVVAPEAYHFVSGLRHSITEESAGTGNHKDKAMRLSLLEQMRQGLALCDPSRRECCERNGWAFHQPMDASKLYRITAAAKALGVPFAVLRAAILRKEIEVATTACGLHLVTLPTVRAWAKNHQ